MADYTGKVVIAAPKVLRFSAARDWDEDTFQYTGPARLTVFTLTRFVDGEEVDAATYEDTGAPTFSVDAMQNAIFDKANALNDGEADDPLGVVAAAASDAPDNALTPV